MRLFRPEMLEAFWELLSKQPRPPTKCRTCDRVDHPGGFQLVRNGCTRGSRKFRVECFVCAIGTELDRLLTADMDVEEKLLHMILHCTWREAKLRGWRVYVYFDDWDAVSPKYRHLQPIKTAHRPS